ncbi:MAG: hypothetical protein PWQ99_1018 [Clostridia bacterium]|nr:hypothetical protein [Clostridia bacterium]MDN5375923.1 hypothetical protein [Thermacetogenium sp.]
MSRSIFQKLLFTYLTIVVLIVGVLAVMLTRFFNDFIFRQEQQQLLAAGREAAAGVLSCSEGRITRGELDQMVDALGAATGARLFIYQGDSAQKLLSAEGGREAKEAPLLADVKRILAGETVVRKKHFSPGLNTYVVFVGMPVKSGGEVSGMVLLFSPIDQVNRTLFRVYGIIWGAALFALLVGGVVIYLTSRRLSRPVVEITEAAAALAQGDFDREIMAAGDDEIGQLAASFDFMRKRLKNLERSRQEFIAAISHELRTPLTSIRGFIQAILDGIIPPEEQKKYLRLAGAESERLTRLVGDLLELARLRAGSIRLRRAPVDLLEVAGEAAAEFRLLAGRRKIAVEPPPGSGRVMVSGDRDRLRQILLNLLSNAVKYTGEDGEILVIISRQGGQVVLTVRDNGTGIPQEDLQRIFEKFQRGSRAGDASAGGSGLGLAIVKELAELHGGRVSAWSEPGRGTEISVELPRIET